MDKFQRFEYTSNIDNTNDWYVYRHSGDNKDCVVVLHGHGSHGDQLLTWKSTRAFWEKFLQEEKVNVFSPNLRDNAWMCPNAVDDLTMLLTENKARYHWKRIILASGSMGASGSLVFAMRHPELVDGVVKLIFGIPRGERGEKGAYPDITESVKGMVLTAGENGLPVWQEAPSGTPEVTAADNGKFLRVVNGVWAAEKLTNVAEEGA
jgi:pimeloyl-ACP methyl ester carboxylesterase